VPFELVFCHVGTHDNETAAGWWKDSATEEDKAYLKKYLDASGDDDIAWLFLRTAFSSVSRTAIVLMQVTPWLPAFHTTSLATA
jgi:4-alpha-glucanotransferase